MKAKVKRRASDNIKFSIGAKLVSIITIIVLVSLGSIIALVSWLVREDLRIAAEENNFEANRRSATEAESSFANVRSQSRALIRTIAEAGHQSSLAKGAADFFFAENPSVAALFFTAAGVDELLLNERFFEARGIDASLADSYRDNNRTAHRRAALGETIVLNAAPHFTVHLLAMFFPSHNGGGAVLFSPEGLSDTFGHGTNQSWLINKDGDILISADFDLVRDGVNVAGYSFIQTIQESPDKSRQSLVETDFGFETKSGVTGGYDTKILSFLLSKWENLKQYAQPLLKRAHNAVLNAFGADASQPPDESADDEIKTVRQFLAFTKLNTGGCIVITGIEYDKVFEGIAATTRRNIYLTVVVLAVSVLFIWFFAKSISLPLKALARAARNIEGGNFEVDLKPKGGDEIGLLTTSFQKMCKALHIFGRFTNRDIAVKAMRGQIKPGGLPKHATVFFSDIREFTSKSENFTVAFGPEASDRIVHWLNEYLTCMVECVEKTNGAVDKFIGDAVMAHWGTAYTSGSAEQDAYNCVFTALMMRKALYEVNKKRPPGDPGNPSIRIGCGINTGIVTAGQIGSDLRMEYTVIGDPVNLASRVEALNKPLGTDIIITENTWKMVRKYFITEELPPVSVKGKEKPVRIFAVVNSRKDEKGPQTLADVRKLLGIKPPDISKVDVNAGEEKFTISGNQE
ncbi:MAG: HAMP domain-containing protein [Treponema sp.]|jgi:adenylate cyclase|nr:HAMP domain-containing protein [Treponema sp.]